MWKLLSGIALVVLLDVAFIWMITVQSDAPEIARAIGPTAAAPRERNTSEPVAISDSTEPVVDDSFEARDVRRAHINKGSYGNADRVAQPETATVPSVAPTKLFEDRIIWIGTTEVPVKIDDREQAPVIDYSKQNESVQASIIEPRTAASVEKKRSFQSKAFGVIKAPYNWVKAFADKIH